MLDIVREEQGGNSDEQEWWVELRRWCKAPSRCKVYHWRCGGSVGTAFDICWRATTLNLWARIINVPYTVAKLYSRPGVRVWPDADPLMTSSSYRTTTFIEMGNLNLKRGREGGYSCGQLKTTNWLSQELDFLVEIWWQIWNRTDKRSSKMVFSCYSHAFLARQIFEQNFRYILCL